MNFDIVSVAAGFLLFAAADFLLCAAMRREVWLRLNEQDARLMRYVRAAAAHADRANKRLDRLQIPEKTLGNRPGGAETR